MNVLVIGNGGREHALCYGIKQSPNCSNLYCIPGSDSINEIASSIIIDVDDHDAILQFCLENKIDLVVIGPELPLTKGLSNLLMNNSILVFGPDQMGAELEKSKKFTKDICKKLHIATAAYDVFDNYDDALNFCQNQSYPLVVKADGLAAGKGVVICKTKKKAFEISNQIFKGRFKSSSKVILEEFLDGEEASYFLIVDKNSFVNFGTAQDHKKVYEKEKGPNTGGMGAYSPAPIIDKELEKKIIERIVRPTLKSLKDKKQFYRGFLYVGLMIKDKNPYLIEYNVRMGDPECQVIIPRLKMDLLKIIEFSLENKLKKLKLSWEKNKCMTIVLCSKGYPGKYKKGKVLKIRKIKNKKNLFIIHAGTKETKGNIVSAGGRVLNIVSKGKNFPQIRNKIIKLIKKINWKSGFYRNDIGWRVIKKL